MKMTASRIAAVLIVALATSAVPARAVSLDDAFAGYSALLGGDSGTRHGWNVAFGTGRSGLGLVIDLSGHMGKAADTSDQLTTLALMAGPRLRFGAGRVRPFVHLIGGVVRTRASVHVFDVDISESATDFGGAAGGGFDVGFGPRWGVRLAGDYRVVKSDGGTIRDPRVSAGVAYRFGTR